MYPDLLYSFSSCLSNSSLVKYRVSHCSVLGPLLFIIFVNDMQKLNRGRVIMYAGDTSILNLGTNLEELETATCTNTSQIIQYFESNN
jgi:hypothetical protein